MSTHPAITYKLAIAHDANLVELAETHRSSNAARAKTAPRSLLSGLGSILIAAGERLGGIRSVTPRDLASAAH